MALLRALGTPLPPQPKAGSAIAVQQTRPRIPEPVRRSASSTQPATPKPVEKTVVARVEAAAPPPVIRAAPLEREPAAITAPLHPVPVLDPPEILGPETREAPRMDSFLSPAPSRKEDVSPARGHLPSISGHVDPAALAGILGLTAFTGMAATVATLTCIALGSGKRTT
jgi:hypothetical protein